MEKTPWVLCFNTWFEYFKLDSHCASMCFHALTFSLWCTIMSERLYTPWQRLFVSLSGTFHAKENVQSDSSFLWHKGAYDTLSQTKKKASSFCLLKRQCVHFFYKGEEVVLQLKIILFLGSLLQAGPVRSREGKKTECNFLWINQACVECVKLHHETGVLLLYLTSFTENAKKPCCETQRLGALNSITNRKKGLHWWDKTRLEVCSFHLIIRSR